MFDRKAGIGPHHGLFIDVGAACRMEDGRVALSLGYRVLAFELRQKCQKMLRDAFAAPLANRSLELRGTAHASCGGRTPRRASRSTWSGGGVLAILPRYSTIISPAAACNDKAMKRGVVVGGSALRPLRG